MIRSRRIASTDCAPAWAETGDLHSLSSSDGDCPAASPGLRGCFF